MQNINKIAQSVLELSHASMSQAGKFEARESHARTSFNLLYRSRDGSVELLHVDGEFISQHGFISRLRHRGRCPHGGEGGAVVGVR